MKPGLSAVTFGAVSILVGACGSPTAPVSVAGTWGAAGHELTPGPIFTMTLAQSGDSITGTGNSTTGYGYEAGAPGNFRVSGVYSRPCIAFTLTYANGSVEQFSGRLVSTSEMSGNAAASGCSRGAVQYVRQ